MNKTKTKTKKIELNLSNYAKKPDLKRATGTDTSKFAKKANLDNLKSHIDRLDIDKSKNTPVNLSKTS